MRFIFLFVVSALYIFLSPFPISYDGAHSIRKPEKSLAVLTVTASAYYTSLAEQANYATGSHRQDIEMNGNGITYSGEKAVKGIIAADPRVFPLGTVLWIPYHGYVKVADIGGAIKGSRIDIFMGEGEKALEEALNWGIRKTTIYVVKWGK